MTSGNKSLCRIQKRSPSACCHCPPFSQALMAELLLMTFGSKNRCVASPHSSPNACCRCPPLTQALMAELELMTFGSKSLCRLPCKLQLPTLLTSADARTVADDSGSGPWRRGQQAQGGLCFVFQYTSGWSPASAGIQTQLEPFFLFCSVCPGGHLPLQATGRSPQGMAANVSAGRARTKTWHQSESALLSNCRKRVKLHWETDALPHALSVEMLHLHTNHVLSRQQQNSPQRMALCPEALLEEREISEQRPWPQHE